MLRRLLTILSALSLLLCVAVVVLWVRSAFVADLWLRQTADVGHLIRSDRGTILYRRCTDLPSPEGHGLRWETGEPGHVRPEPRGWVGELGLGSGHGEEFLAPAGAVPDGVFLSPRVIQVSQWWVPHWAVAAAAAMLPLLAAARAWHRVRRKPGLCPSCGYDLRATPGRCPECGAVPAEARAAHEAPAPGELELLKGCWSRVRVIWSGGVK